MLKRWVNAGLQFKFLITVVLVVFSSAFISALIITHNETVLWKDFLFEKSKRMGNYVADISKEPIIYKDYIQLDNIVKKINNDPEMVYAIIFNLSGKPLTTFFSNFNLKLPMIKHALASKPDIINTIGFAELLKRDNPISEVKVPIAIDDEHLGYIVLGISQEKMNTGIQKTIKGIILANLIALLIAFLLLALLQKFIIEPIINLSHIIKKITFSKNYALRVDVHSDDEVGLLADGFNTMITQVDSHQKILEEKVALRTAELNDVNVQLSLEKKDLQKANQELKSAQDQLVQAEKMTSLGILAAGIAHEVNNPMAFINSNLDCMKQYVASLEVIVDAYEDLEQHLCKEGMSAAQEYFKRIDELKTKEAYATIKEDFPVIISETQSGALRVSKIVTDLKMFSHVNTLEMEYADIHSIIGFSLNIVGNHLKSKAQLLQDYAVLPQVYCSLQQLSQVFISLLMNAVQAIKDRGTILIKTFERDARIVVEISDTGCGISKELIPHIFEPFFTTKEVGEGTGLGLSIAYGIVQKHNGEIIVSSEAGRGTTFTICIPINPAPDHFAV